MRRILLPVLFAISLAALVTPSAASAQGAASTGPDTEALMSVPISGLRIGAQAPNIKNPLAGDKNAIVAGQKLFHAMNCVGCHAPEGGGGMGPPLSDKQWLYGDSPANIYLSILHGRPNGMPAWGGALPPQAIWSLVSYIQTLSANAATYEQPSKLNVK